MSTDASTWHMAWQERKSCPVGAGFSTKQEIRSRRRLMPRLQLKINLDLFKGRQRNIISAVFIMHFKRLQPSSLLTIKAFFFSNGASENIVNAITLYKLASPKQVDAFVMITVP